MDESVFNAVVVGSMVLDLAVAILCLTVRQPCLGLGRLVGAVGLTGLCFAAKWAVVSRLGVGLFGLICLIYLDLVVVVPVVGLTVLVLVKRTRPVTWLAGLSLALPLAGIYATYWEPFNLQVETAEVAVATGRAGSRPIRVGVLSDIQASRVTDYERGAIERLMTLEPDLILIAGDVFQGEHDAFERERPALRDLLGRLHAPGGVYLVQGDVDRGPDRAWRLVEGTDIQLLFNESKQVEIHGRRVTIGGVELEFRSPAARRLVDQVEDAPGTDDLRILLAHRPDVVQRLRPNSRIDLVVAGHTHGGQVVVPGFGPLMTLSDVPRSVAAGGLHVLDGNRIYVSRGVGCERNQAPRIRFLCPPEIGLVTLIGSP